MRRLGAPIIYSAIVVMVIVTTMVTPRPPRSKGALDDGGDHSVATTRCSTTPRALELP